MVYLPMPAAAAAAAGICSYCVVWMIVKWVSIYPFACRHAWGHLQQSHFEKLEMSAGNVEFVDYVWGQ